MKLDIKQLLKSIILNTKNLKSTFNKKHPKSKYTIDLVINEILFTVRNKFKIVKITN